MPVALVARQLRTGRRSSVGDATEAVRGIRSFRVLSTASRTSSRLGYGQPFSDLIRLVGIYRRTNKHGVFLGLLGSHGRITNPQCEPVDAGSRRPSRRAR